MKIVTQIILSAILLTSCKQEEKANTTVETKTEQKTMVTTEDKTKNALAFINGYNENCNKMQQSLGAIDWVNSNNLSTKAFKSELKRIIDEAYKQDPELGLDADPIFNAQDNPNTGFELDSFDEKTNYLTVKDKDNSGFKVTLKVIDENGNWLVDGCGIVNIPSDK